MQLSHPVVDLLGENTGRVLGRLAVLPDGASGRRIHELSGVKSLRTTQQVLDRLVGIGLVDVQVIGNAHRYVLNREHALWEPVEVLLEMPAAIESELIELISEEFGAGVEHAIVYGSFARGTADAASDIDVVLVWSGDGGSPDHRARQVELAVARVRSRTGNRAQFLGLTAAELRALVEAGDPLVESLRSEGRALTEGTDLTRVLGAK